MTTTTGGPVFISTVLFPHTGGGGVPVQAGTGWGIDQVVIAATHRASPVNLNGRYALTLGRTCQHSRNVFIINAFISWSPVRRDKPAPGREGQTQKTIYPC